MTKRRKPFEAVGLQDVETFIAVGNHRAARRQTRGLMIITRTVGTIAILELHGPLEAGEGDPGVRKAVRLALDNGARTVVLNLLQVAAIDSSGVSDLASGHLTCVNRGARLKLCCLSQKLKDIFVITRLQTVFDSYDTEADAIASVSAST